MSITKTCRITKQPFIVSDKEIAFYKKMGVPIPTISPVERIRIMMSFRNEWKLFKRKCDATGDEIISAYPKDSPFKVYKNEIWWGDSWDATDYGRDFNFNKPFFEQYAELQKEVPREGTSIFNCENSTGEVLACEKCGDEIYSTYTTEREEKIYCEKCYLEEIY
ncbi:hypothetical protein HZC20_02125 [Candidatus Peregrinibacteria bacterium]|nr:hypothetical protein [Candidatus Peregrinibacteria bacterium]